MYPSVMLLRVDFSIISDLFLQLSRAGGQSLIRRGQVNTVIVWAPPSPSELYPSKYCASRTSPSTSSTPLLCERYRVFLYYLTFSSFIPALYNRRKVLLSFQGGPLGRFRR